MRLLFHCCCGPCAGACCESLQSESIIPELFWYNPNIHPFTEYKNRKDSLVQFGAEKNLKVNLNDEYGLRAFIRSVGDNMENGPETSDARRCLYCYRVRLEKTAMTASRQGFDGFSTSLLASPYQRHDDIRKIAGELAEKYKTVFVYRDFRIYFREAQAKARGMGLYMQKYCGCIFSEEERYFRK